MDTMGNELLDSDLNLDLALGVVVKDIATKEDMARWLMKLHKNMRHGNIQKNQVLGGRSTSNDQHGFIGRSYQRLPLSFM